MWRRILGLSAFAAVSIFATAHSLCAYYTKQGLNKLTDHENTARTYLPKIIEDLKVIEAHPPFPTWSRERNAEPLLTLWVSWEGKGFQKLESPEHKALREITAKYPRAANDPNQFAALAADPLLDKVDTRWMRRLKDFDHWAPLANEKITEMLSAGHNMNSIGRVGLAATLPTPSYGELRDWALVHFAKEFKRGHAREGLATYRKTAELAYTSSSLIGAMVSVAMLKTERNLAIFGNEPAWPIVDINVVTAFHKVAWTWAGLLKLGMTQDFPKELSPYFKQELGLCAGASETVSGLVAISDFLEPQIPLEVDFTEPLARSRQLQARAQAMCGVEALGFMNERVPASANPLFAKDTGAIFTLVSGAPAPGLLFNPARVPYLRRAVAMALMTIAMPNFFHFYKEEAH